MYRNAYTQISKYEHAFTLSRYYALIFSIYIFIYLFIFVCIFPYVTNMQDGYILCNAKMGLYAHKSCSIM